jgi:Golgi phosphoprotein 3 (GPP34)
MQTLGEDVLLLAMGQNGTITAHDDMHFALAGSELARLAALRRIDFAKGRIVVVDPAPTRDRLLDEAFASIRASKRPVRASTWVADQQPTVTQQYLERMAAAGAVRYEAHRTLGLFRTPRWYVDDFARVSRLEAQLDAIAFSSGPIDRPQAAFGGLIYTIGLHAVLYPGHKNRHARKRLAWIAERDDAAWAVDEAVRRAQATLVATFDAASMAGN